MAKDHQRSLQIFILCKILNIVNGALYCQLCNYTLHMFRDSVLHLSSHNLVLSMTPSISLVQVEVNASDNVSF